MRKEKKNLQIYLQCPHDGMNTFNAPPTTNNHPRTTCKLTAGYHCAAARRTAPATTFFHPLQDEHTPVHVMSFFILIPPLTVNSRYSDLI